MRRLRRSLLGALLGALPGGVLVALSAPVTGELELTLGAGGMLLAALGLALGAVLGASRAGA